MKYLGRLAIFGCIVVSFVLGRGLHAQEAGQGEVIATETPELIPLANAGITLRTDMARASEIYTKLMWAAYCRIGERNIRKSKAAYDTLIEELERDSESIENGVLSASDMSFIYTQRAALRFPKLQDLTGAKEDVRKAIELNPENVDANWILAKILKEQFDQKLRENRSIATLQKEMLSVGKRIIELDPDHSDAHYYLGTIARYFGQVELNPDYIELAITSFKALTRIMPFRAEHHWQLGELYEMQERHKEALHSYERVVTIVPENERVRNRLGQLYLQTGDFTSAVQTFLTVLESLKNSPVPRGTPTISDVEIEAHYGIGLAYQAQDNFEKAEHHITQAINLLETRARSMRGGTRSNRARSSDRVELLTRLRNYHHDLAQIYLRFNEPQKAVETFTKVLEIDEKYVPALTGIGIAYQMLDDVKRAETYLRQAVTLSPNDESPDAYNALGYLYAEQGVRLEEAATLVRRALESTPTSGAYLDSLGFIYFKQGKLDVAIENLEQANRYLPDTPEILSHLADAYLEKGLKQKALETLERAVQLEPENVELRQKLDTIKSGR